MIKLLNFFAARPQPATIAAPSGPAKFEGFVDEISNTHVIGWVRDRRDPNIRVAFEAVLAGAGETRLIGNGRAELFYPALESSGFGDSKYGFKIALPASLSPADRAALAIRPVGSETALPRAPEFQGFVDERSTRHVAGWVRNRFDAAARVSFEAVLPSPDGERILGQGTADAYSAGLAKQSIGDGHYSFRLLFADPLTEAEREAVFVRPKGAEPLDLAPNLVTSFGQPQPKTPKAKPHQFQGYVDEISGADVSGWVRDLRDPELRVAVEATIAMPNKSWVIGRGRADIFYPPLQPNGFGDAKYGFKIPLPGPLSPAERAHLIVRPSGAEFTLERAPQYQGFVDERSVHHAAGWVRNRFDPAERVAFEAVLPTAQGERIIGQGNADSYYTALALQSIGDGRYGFNLHFNRPLTEAERDTVFIRPVGGEPLALSPNLVTGFDLLSFFAMDIVNNCNLRCPFCLYDYSETKSTRFMSDETFDAALRLIPYVHDGDFWLSCLHEPSLHPDFLRLIERIPRQWRHKVMFTTNLAKRMPASYFAGLAASGVHHINVSVESLDAAIFERFRKGSRFPIFKENWEKLLTAWRAEAAPPRLRYIMMAYQSNLAEIPSLVKFLREECLAHQVEIRYTYDMDHIPLEFRQAEYLRDADWDWLAAQLSGYDPDEVHLSPPPEPIEDAPAHLMKSFNADKLAAELVRHERASSPPPADSPTETGPAVIAAASTAPVSAGTAEAAPAGVAQTIAADSEPNPPQPSTPAADDQPVRLPLNIQAEWDGKMVICGKWDHPSERRLLAVTSINDLPDPYGYLISLPRNLPRLRAARPRKWGDPKIEGFVDEILATAVTGWVRNLLDPQDRTRVKVAITMPGETRIIAEGVADRLCPTLIGDPFGDAHYGFRIEIPEDLTAVERDHLVVAPAHDNLPLDRAPKYQGYIDERSTRHLNGWVRNRFNQAERVSVEAVLVSPAGERVLATGRAETFDPEIAKYNVGDSRYGFRFLFDQPLTEAERDALIVRPIGDPTPLEISPRLVTTFNPANFATA
jgi:sulfatase maturation enzyme AslB (radical SAM superfamily)